MKGKKCNRQSIDFISASPTSAASCLFTFPKGFLSHIWTTATPQAALGTSRGPGTRIYTTTAAFCETCAKTLTLNVPSPLTATLWCGSERLSGATGRTGPGTGNGCRRGRSLQKPLEAHLSNPTAHFCHHTVSIG